MTETSVRSRTGLSVRAHQRRTATNHLRLREPVRIPNLLAVSAYGGVTLLSATTALAEHHPVVLLRAVLAGISRSDHAL
jgi:hypothetical protein